MQLELSPQNTQISNFMTICPVGAEFSLRADEGKDMTKLIVSSWNFANLSKN